RSHFTFPTLAPFVFTLRAMAKPSSRIQPTNGAKPKYQRIVIKLSGEALREQGSRDTISPKIVQRVALQIQEVHALGVEVAVVVGGGNIWRGLVGRHSRRRGASAD